MTIADTHIDFVSIFAGRSYTDDLLSTYLRSLIFVSFDTGSMVSAAEKIPATKAIH